jgi:hypothetical protein
MIGPGVIESLPQQHPPIIEALVFVVIRFGVLEEGGVDATTMAPDLAFGCQYASKTEIS